MDTVSTQSSGFPLRDAVTLALAHLDARSHDLLPPWSAVDVAALHGEAARQLSRQTDAAAILAPAVARLTAGISLVSFLEAGGPLGPAWLAHPIASPALTSSYRLREPDLTRGLAALMGPAAGQHGARRALSFLRVLLELAGTSAVAVRETITEQTRPIVIAEHSVISPQRGVMAGPQASGRTRIDLLFEWPVNQKGRRAVVVVEAKLGAVVGEGQLRPYREEAQRRARGGPVALILLTAAPDNAERRHRAWRPVRWFALLRRWEALLAEAVDADPEFARLRAHLWRYVLDNPRALP